MVTWHLETYPIKSLKENPKNPRQIDKHQFKHLRDLIAKFGLIDKPIINLDKTIIGGHQRIKALKLSKVKFVECWIPNRLLEQQEIDQLCIGLNLNQGTFDYDILANEYEPIDLLKWGFTEEQLLGISEDIEGNQTESGETENKKNTCPKCGHEF